MHAQARRQIATMSAGSHGPCLRTWVVRRASHAELTRRLAIVPRATGTKPDATGTVSRVAESAQKLGAELAEQAGRQWRKLDAEYNVSGKAQRLARRLEEGARDIDQTYGVRRKTRSSLQYVSKMWPVWSGQLDEFAQTWYGKVVLLGALLFVISSPLFWQFLNFVLILWWLAIPIGALLIGQAQQRATAEAMREAQERAKRQQNPWADIFSGAAGRGQTSASPGAQRGRSWSPRDEGPVIDAEFVVLEEDGAKSNGTGRK